MLAQQETADVWKWLAATFASGFIGILLAIGSLWLRQKPSHLPYERRHLTAPTERHPWGEDRSNIYNRIEKIDAEIERLRDWKHNEVIPAVTILKLMEPIVRELEGIAKELDSRVSRLEREGR